ncbi:hypothetical protein E6L38_06530 [Bifidobacterium longum subsp. infantis]|uniref:Uncharacterized protein n=1 Tax=Bifidobacterium longum subsp. infantis TaxID=1682 RepID=A0A4S5BG67_BIFLI|nr:hypothetical protein E6L38_06530 [Bifidobacterium longum subsp. infantis]
MRNKPGVIKSPKAAGVDNHLQCQNAIDGLWLFAVQLGRSDGNWPFGHVPKDVGENRLVCIRPG